MQATQELVSWKWSSATLPFGTFALGSSYCSATTRNAKVPLSESASSRLIKSRQHSVKSHSRGKNYTVQRKADV